MKRILFRCIGALAALLIAQLSMPSSAWSASVFADFSSLTVSPSTSGSLTNAGLTITFTGDNGEILTDSWNGSSGALLLGDSCGCDSVASLTMDFSVPVSALLFDLDAMHSVQNDAITASAGTWTMFPASLSLAGNTLTSTAPVINPGGSGIDDDLAVTLSFGVPITSVQFTNTGIFALDIIETTAVPIPAAFWLFGSALGLLGWMRRKKA